MSQKLILHIPTGLYFNYSFNHIAKKEEIHIILTDQLSHRGNDTEIFTWLATNIRYTLWIHNQEDGHTITNDYEVTVDEFLLVDLVKYEGDYV